MPAVPDCFRDVLAQLPSGILAHFGLADTQLRNNYLGHSAVDRDIDEFSESLAGRGSPLVISSRIGGDRWAALLSGTDPGELSSVIADYERVQSVNIGWQATAKKRFRWTRRRRSVQPARLLRGVRCVFAPIGPVEEISAVWETLQTRLPRDHVNQVADDRESESLSFAASAKPRWRCIDKLDVSFFCPYCHSTQFDWYEGDTTVFGASGLCLDCQADVRFQNYVEFVNDPP